MPTHVLERPAPEPDAVARYAGGPTGVLDLFRSQVTARTAVILLHGGFWRSAYDRVHLRALAAALAADGVSVALPEYRRVGDEGGGVPGTLEDLDQIVRAVPALLDTDLAHVTIAGHSAGGHLAVLAALRAPVPPARVVSLAGVLDLSEAHRAGLSRGAVDELLGDPAPDGEAIAAVDPLALALPSSELEVVHGLADGEVPPAYSERYAARDPRISLTLIEHADHYDLIDPLSAAFSRVRAALTAR